MVKRVLFDTSSLVPALLEEHPFHIPCLFWLERALKIECEGYISTHTLAELYAVLTRMPRQPRLLPREVEKLLGNLAGFQKVVLNAEDYGDVIRRLVTLKLPGGVIYDALIAQAALTAKVNLLLTVNPKDFLRLGPDVAEIVVVPSGDLG
ncbi:MAG: type II toxin-antitoxin system VapC family toxin [Leptolyngbya sp. RL_3_1]|nr:type II toxin-antitoxin system VapC family toxin [Leptolyngbya sp. RL_3_1]